MRIVYVFRSLAVWGGIERILVDKMNALVTMYGEEVWMLTADQGNHAIPYKLEEKVSVENLDINFHHQYRYGIVRRLWTGWRLRQLFIKRLRQRFQEIQPDVVVAVATSYADSVLKAIGRTDVPLVVESHSICQRTIFHSWRPEQWRLRRCMKRATAIVALTEGDANDWRRLYGDKVSVIPNLVHLYQRGNVQRSPSKNRRVIFVGRFDYQKRTTDMISIWRRVFPGHEDWCLDIYGEGEQQQQVEQAAREANANITIHKPTADIFDRYMESAVLVSTSLFEPFGLVIPEAMSCGVPVVAYACPYGPVAIITDGKDGYLVPPGDEATFAQRLCRLMDDEALRQNMGQAAILSSQRYDAQQVMPLWKKLFDNYAL